MHTFCSHRLFTPQVRQLAGDLPLLSLPTDVPRAAAAAAAAAGGARGAVLRFAIDAPVMASLVELARSHGARPFAVLLAAWAALLHRYTAQDDILIRTPMACRNHLGVDGVVGDFINPVVLRVDLSAEEGAPPGAPLAFAALVARCAAVAGRAEQHQTLPFAMLLERLGPSRDSTIRSLLPACLLAFHLALAPSASRPRRVA